MSGEHPIQTLASVVDGSELPSLSKNVWSVHVDQTILAYIVEVVQATRLDPDLLLGVSPRGSLGLYRGGQALAALQDRDHVPPDDVKRLIQPVLAHRCLVRPESALRDRIAAQVLADIVERAPLDIGNLS